MFKERSVFDLLCDFWYLPGFMVYLTMMFKPIWMSSSPDDAIENLNELNPE
jgi:hypothetical protein